MAPTWTRRRADAPEPALLIVIEPLLEQKDSRGERVCQMTGKKPLPATRYRNPLPARPAFRRQESPDIRHLVSRVWPGWSIIEGRLRDGTQHGAVFSVVVRFGFSVVHRSSGFRGTGSSPPRW